MKITSFEFFNKKFWIIFIIVIIRSGGENYGLKDKLIHIRSRIFGRERKSFREKKKRKIVCLLRTIVKPSGKEGKKSQSDLPGADFVYIEMEVRLGEWFRIVVQQDIRVSAS